MLAELVKGQNMPLPGTAVRVAITAATPLDVSAVVVGKDGKARRDEDFVFYNAPTHPTGIALIAAGTALDCELGRADPDAEKVVVLLSADDRPVPAFEVRLVTAGADTSESFARFLVAPSHNETVVIAVELYLRNDQWKVRAVGQGYDDGLAGAAKDLGIEIEDAPDVTPHTPADPQISSTPAHQDGPAGPLDSSPAASPLPITPEPAVAPQARSAPVVGPAAEPQLVERARRLDVDISAQRRLTEISSMLTRLVEVIASTYPQTEIDRRITALDHTYSSRSEQLSKTMETLRSALYHKYRSKLPNGWDQLSDYPNTNAPTTPDRWTDEGNALIQQIVQSGPVLLKANRLTLMSELVNATRALLSSYKRAVTTLEDETARRHQAIYEDEFSTFVRKAESSGHSAIRTWEASARATLPHPHHTIRPVWLSDVAATALTTGVGTLHFPLGQVAATSVNYDLGVNPGRSTSTTLSKRTDLPLSRAVHSIPYIVDLDECGGFVTDDRRIVENVVLDMLALLPAGRVKIDAVDPVELGASLNFLYGLGDAGPKVFGDKIWGSHNISELLIELENHVAFVTQKYLQGTHETLTSYNREAGEVAEPYRLVLLFDHPKSFSKDGENWDREALTRLRRLADVGRRAGVFLLATVPAATSPHEAVKPAELSALASAMTSGRDPEIVQALGLPTSGSRKGPVHLSDIIWQLTSDTPPTEQQLADLLAHIERQMHAAANVQVDPAKVYALAQAEAHRAAAKGTRPDQVIADPHNPKTWWSDHSANAAVSRFGRMGASNVAELRIDSGDFPGALVGGRTGSGKSVLLHSLILGWAMQYPPEELEFYLIDFKEGVEFKPYAAGLLPHARIVAIETNRDFGISVLESLDEEIEKRGELFKAVGGGEVNFGTYRSQSGEQLPRIILVIDEFHMMLEEEDEASRKAAALIERVIRQGRAFGVHAVLASQSVSGSAQKIRVALDQIKTRLVLSSSSKDSELLLADGNVDAQLLDKPGEGIINTKGGVRDANNRFQCAYWSGQDREDVISALHALAQQRGFTRRPVVFEGNAEAPITDQPSSLFTRSSPIGELVLPVGAPMSLADPVCMRVARAAGGNMLVISPDALDSLALMTASLLATGITVDAVDFAAMASPWDEVFKGFTAYGARLTHSRQFPSLLSELNELVMERHALNDFRGRGRVLVLPGLQRARDLNPDDYDDKSPSKILAAILRDGPEVGVHVLAWADRYATFQRRFDHASAREFSHKLLGPLNESDSRVLADSTAAAKLTPAQFLYDDFDTGRQLVTRRFSLPKDPVPDKTLVETTQWLWSLAEQSTDTSDV
ncbi:MULTISPECIES: FtsK/SpoIIIE domain-containing protein [Rhodococcus]|uniref:FtsK/SpoIIIE domain-containing protein n=1 Tax=Rhodococcus TaxID=1827 RepID=UPI000933FD9F|nr:MULTISPECIES: FtsK/SpoIIIE domain-containing protein [Rhodococcus]MBP2214777.1 stress response protein SCP2 [Rhodococcus ruber]NCL77148.1 hypothetical protein [Rhodococcus sp. YH1]NCL78840.1 hypothetical protein [Rhodococcus sp. YH1]WML60885.1 FtsK/SpoIIIE domain-containing protein [Rhodococcus sp. AH-ZY2]